MFYLSVERIGDNICERYIENGEEHMRRVPFEPTLYHHCKKETGLKDIYGKSVVPKTFSNMRDATQWKRRMGDMSQEALGMENFAFQYITEVYSGPVSFDLAEIRIAFVDIEVHSNDGFPYPEIARWEIDAITHYDSIDKKFYVFSLREWWREKSELDKRIVDRVEYKMYQNERDMMLAYVAFWKSKTPTAVTGWNSELFDIPYIVNRLKILFGENAPNRLSPWGKVTERMVKQNEQEHQTYIISGISSLDYMVMFKKFTFKTMASYKLDYVANKVIGEKKVGYEGSLWKLALENPQRYVDYNIKDVDLIIRMDESLLLFQLVSSLAYYAHINLSDVMSPVRTWDAIIYNSLHSQNIIIPEKKRSSKQEFEGAYVKDPITGMYRWVVSFDLTSLDV